MLGLLPTPLYHDEDWNNWLKGDIRSLAVTGCSAEGVVVDSSPAVKWTLESNTTGVEVNLSSMGNVAFFQVGTNAGGGWNGGTVRIKIQLVSDPNVSVMLETRIFDYFIDLSSHSMGNATIERGNSTQLGYTVYGLGGPYNVFSEVRYVISEGYLPLNATTIDENGLLSVGTDERADSFTVFAQFENTYNGSTPDGKTYYGRGTSFNIIDPPEPKVGAPKSGDLDGNGTTASDALQVARFVISGPGQLTSAQLAAVDMDEDGVLTMADVVRILRKAAGLP
jgi:hypothetical protein